jgi:hypothetical protein
MIYFLIKHHTTKTFGKVEVQLHVFLISALDGREWLFHAQPTYKKGRNSDTNQTGGWVSLRWHREKSLSPAIN